MLFIVDYPDIVHVIYLFTLLEQAIFVNMKEHEIIDIALDQLKRTAGIEAHNRLQKGQMNRQVDLVVDGDKFHFVVEVKKEIRPHQIDQLKLLNEQLDGNLLVVAGKIYPRVKDELRALSIPYLEANGNIFLKRVGKWVWVETNPPLKLTPGKGNRAFTKTGLKVLFHFLLEPQLINEPQRYIAARANVAVGNIPQILDGLKVAGYIYPVNDATYMWEDRKAFLDRWVTEYASTLRPTLEIGRYQLTREWTAIELNDETTLWGGEPGADLFLDHLRPEEYILYTKETNAELIRKYALKPHPKGEVIAYQWFWDEGLTGRTGFVPPILIYTDLMIKGDKRCRETANKILHEYLNFV